MSLVEVMVVAGIVTVLVSALGLVVFPAAKGKGVETRIRSDLRQLVTAINIYRSDNDDKLPPRLSALPEDTPRRLPNWPKLSEYSQGMSDNGEYYYCLPFRVQVFNDRFASTKWDAESDVIVMATFYRKPTNKKFVLQSERVQGQSSQSQFDEVLCLGGFLDGHVGWVRSWSQYMEEFARKSYLLGDTR
jgi:type II secretory pathway pseudopilin PulG